MLLHGLEARSDNGRGSRLSGVCTAESYLAGQEERHGPTDHAIWVYEDAWFYRLCHATETSQVVPVPYKSRKIAEREAAQMYQTKNDLPAQMRTDVIEILNARLADSIDLMHQAKQAHWNVKGPSFIALHKLFDEVVDAAEEYMDLLAERAVQLGGTAEGTIQVATTRTGLKAYPLTLTKERDHVEALSSALATYGTSIRRAIDQTDGLGDMDTADIFTEISRGVDKYLWFVEAHLG